MKDPAQKCTRRRSCARPAFTLVELLVVVMIIMLLATILMPSLAGARIQMMRTKCGHNLKEIAKACLAYASDKTMNRLQDAAVFPSVTTAANVGDWYKISESTAVEGNTAAMWLLVKYKFIGGDYFLCPEAESRRGYEPIGKDDEHFKPKTFSYAYLAQAYGEGDERKYSTGPDSIRGTMIILADDNPHISPISGVESGVANDANSQNHKGEGQNVADTTGAVNFVTSPEVFVRVEGSTNILDNIYLNGDGSAGPARAATADGKIAAIDDIYLVP